MRPNERWFDALPILLLLRCISLSIVARWLDVVDVTRILPLIIIAWLHICLIGCKLRSSRFVLRPRQKPILSPTSTRLARFVGWQRLIVLDFGANCKNSVKTKKLLYCCLHRWIDSWNPRGNPTKLAIGLPTRNNQGLSNAFYSVYSILVWAACSISIRRETLLRLASACLLRSVKDVDSRPILLSVRHIQFVLVIQLTTFARVSEWAIDRGRCKCICYIPYMILLTTWLLKKFSELF